MNVIENLTVVIEQRATISINVGEGVFDLAHPAQNLWYRLEA